MQVIERYPKIFDTYISMLSHHGISHGPLANHTVRKTDSIIAERIDHEDLVAIDRWLRSLNKDELLAFVGGDLGEIMVITELAGEVGTMAHQLFHDLFEGVAP